MDTFPVSPAFFLSMLLALGGFHPSSRLAGSSTTERVIFSRGKADSTLAPTFIFGGAYRSLDGTLFPSQSTDMTKVWCPVQLTSALGETLVVACFIEDFSPVVVLMIYLRVNEIGKGGRDAEEPECSGVY